MEDWDNHLHTPQHHHQHDSDDEEEDTYSCDDEAIRQPSMSDDGSFLRTAHNATTLHHRRHSNHSGDDGRSKSMSPTPSHNGVASPHRRRQFALPNNKKKRHRVYFWLVLGLVVGYLLLMVVGYFVLRRHDRRLFQPLTSRASFLEPNGRLYAMRERLEQKRLEERLDMTSQLSNRASQRAHRTTPMLRAAPPKKYEVDMLIDRMGDAGIVAETAARVQDLCGAHARNASQYKRGSFPARNVLNSKSRVLITGILNPVGFHLALALKERCGVEIIGGIDPVFPNTVAHRLALQNRIELLSTNIPKLVQPVLQPLVGLDPRPSKNWKTSMVEVEATGEMSVLDMRPTHIVHLSSYSVEEYKDFGDESVRNLQSPYVRPGQTADMFVIRSSQLSMEQILASLEGAPESSTPPQFLYASTAATQDPTHNSTKLVDEMLADLYGSLHAVYSVGLRLPNTIYGPWGRSQTPVYDLSQAAIEQLRNNGTLRVNHAQHDRDFVYVDGKSVMSDIFVLFYCYCIFHSLN
jgi:nucleoside-diphosphate-sugar epimerase